MANIVYPNIIVAALKGLVDLTTDDLRLVLCNGHALDATETSYSELTNELSTADGYTAGGKLVTTCTVVLDGTTAKVDISDVEWLSSGTIGPFTRGFLYDDTAANDDLIFGFDFGSAKVVSDTVTFTVEVNAAGLFTVS